MERSSRSATYPCAGALGCAALCCAHGTVVGVGQHSARVPAPVLPLTPLPPGAAMANALQGLCVAETAASPSQVSALGWAPLRPAAALWGLAAGGAASARGQGERGVWAVRAPHRSSDSHLCNHRKAVDSDPLVPATLDNGVVHGCGSASQVHARRGARGDATGMRQLVETAQRRRQLCITYRCPCGPSPCSAGRCPGPLRRCRRSSGWPRPAARWDDWPARMRSDARSPFAFALV